MKKNDIKQQVLLAVGAAEAKKAEDVSVLHLPKESSAFTDYFVVCSGANPRQVQAIADEVDERLSKVGFEPNHREGYDTAEWVLLDYVDFVVHIFSNHARKFYDLERLWKSAKPVSVDELTGKAASAKKTGAKATTGKAPAKKTATKKTAMVRKKAPVRKAAAKKPVAKKAVRKVAAKRPTARKSSRSK